ncbi:MAG: AAA family ATPase, partial [Halioglobus sp.]|nr:AAA family ATPase [Halioglobus sp.]
MARQKTAFVCSDCGSDYAKWQGQCSDCGAWNTLAQVRLEAARGAGRAAARAGDRSGFAGALDSAQVLQDIAVDDLPRFSSGAREFDRVLGGGLVPGSAILVGGEPGAGKSTLLLQTMCYLAGQMDALYITGEESLQQVALRARRLQLPADKLRLMSETNVERILASARQLRPRVLVVDSIQVVHLDELASAPGSVSQVRECAACLIRFAKLSGTVLFLVGHVTKDGSLAGPKVLEHMIDCSILLEGDHDSRFRTLRGQKNRFGAVNELGVFAMTGQ